MFKMRNLFFDDLLVMHHPSFMVLNPISIVSGSDVFMALRKGDLKELKTLLNDGHEKNPINLFITKVAKNTFI